MRQNTDSNGNFELLHGLVNENKLAELEELDELWVFGYGSLVWLPNFAFSAKRVGKIYGWERRFYQGNSTHRGQPGKPGRVATLMRDDSGKTYGCAYQLVGRAQIAAALDHLNMRESTLGGYCLVVEQFVDELTDETKSVLVYTATCSNCQFTGEEPIPDLAKVIAFSRGPSGTNREYLFRLAQWQKENLPHVKDDHLYELERATRKVIDVHITETVKCKRRPSNASLHLPNQVARNAE